MDVKLDSLIEKIKKEGVEDAQKQSGEILKDAKQKASSITEKAQKEADKIIEDGKKQAEQFKKNAESDLQQAARNTQLLLKEKITNLFDNVFKREVGEKLTPDFLKELILKIVGSWAENSEAEIVVNEKDKKKLEDLLFSGVKKEMKDSITIRASKEVASGFQIGMKDSQVYYDFSDEAIADVLKTLISPGLKKILDKENG
jgi:V/A-type H+-transporting ATPase subunit E